MGLIRWLLSHWNASESSSSSSCSQINDGVPSQMATCSLYSALLLTRTHRGIGCHLGRSHGPHMVPQAAAGAAAVQPCSALFLNGRSYRRQNSHSTAMSSSRSGINVNGRLLHISWLNVVFPRKAKTCFKQWITDQWITGLLLANSPWNGQEMTERGQFSDIGLLLFHLVVAN